MSLDAALLNETERGREVIRAGGEMIGNVRDWRSGAVSAADFPDV